MAANTHVETMDRMYRWTRHIYDITRKHYLLGRDRMMRQMQISPNDHVLEIGCGTARNLLFLARLHPFAFYHGLDASKEMLTTARAKVRRSGLEAHIDLKLGLAEELDYNKTFGLSKPFDSIFFSYSLTIIPTWEQALESAYANLRPGGNLYVADFWDQANYPDWFGRTIKKWLKKFYVEYKPGHIEHFKKWQNEGRGVFQMEGVAGRYAWIGCFTKKS
jgi:S-adenosylmethionine-diacylgycerolhomoserine-N-methlytransferase